jgi:hypothetical protein
MSSRLLAIGLLSVAACAGSGSDPPPALFGGFAPTSGAAVILAPATCNIPFVGSTSISGVLLELVSGADACNVLTAAKQCGTGAGSTSVLLAAVSGVPGGSVGPAGPGTYPWLANPPTGPFLASTGTAAKVDGTCGPLSGSPVDVSGGTITLAAVSSSSVRGSTDLRFENGQVFTYAFDVATCPVTMDICDLFALCFTYTCVP